MGRRVMVIVMVLVVALFVYLGYNSYDAKRAGLSGDVFPHDSSLSRTKAGMVRRRSFLRRIRRWCIRHQLCRRFRLHRIRRRCRTMRRFRRARRRRMERPRERGRFDQPESAEWDGVCRQGQISALPARKSNVAAEYRDRTELHYFCHG